jgi:RNA polymerase sigma-70 factor (ECF subfamily)
LENIQKIIKKCLRGNSEAHKALYLAHKNSWILTSLRYGKDSQESEDILQEGILQVFKDLHQFNSKRASFKTWSQRVIVHAALRYLKKNNWQNLFVDLDAVENDFYTENNMMSKLSANEILEHIRTLPNGYRLVFNLYAIEDYSHKEIAAKLNISVGTSKSQLFKARKMLKEIVVKSYINE